MLTILGLIAGAFTSFAMLPQVIQCWRTKSAHDVSLGTYILLVIGVCLWITYGVLVGDMPLIVANGVGLVLSSTIVYLKVRYG